MPFILHFTFYDIAFLGAVFISLTLSLFLWIAPKENQFANRWLAILMVVVALWIIRVLVADIDLAKNNPLLNLMPLQFSMALGPLIYFYIRQITRPEYIFRRKDFLHFVPLLYELSIQEFAAIQNMKAGQTIYHKFSFVVPLFAFLSFMIYLYLCRLQINHYYRKKEFNGGDRYRNELLWLDRSINKLTVLWLLWIPFTAVDYFNYHYELSVQHYYPLYLLLISMIIWIAARIHLKTETVMTVNVAVKQLLPAGLKQKASWLKIEVKEKGYYRDSELTLTSLAEKLNLHTHELSRIINTVFRKSFNDFINEYRVREIAFKMRDPRYDHITLLGLAYESGFNSQSSFHRIFKQFTGKTPLEYKNHLQKVLPSYKLRGFTQTMPLILSHVSPPGQTPKKSTGNPMFKSYFKIAWRSIRNNKLHAFINVAGLAAGMSVTILIGLWIFDELSFDSCYANRNRIAQVMQNQTNNGEVQTIPNEPFPLGAELTKNYGSDFKYVSMATGAGSRMLASGDKKLSRTGVFFEPPATEMLELHMIKGSRNGLNDPASILLSASVASAFFGDADPMNKVMKIDDKMDVKVTGVYEDQPSNSTFANVTFIAPWALFVQSNARFFNGLKDNWGRSAFLTYVQVADNTDMGLLSEKIRKVKINKAPEEAAHRPELFLHPMRNWHLRDEFKNGVSTGGRIEFVWIFGIIGVVVLLLAGINFMNLSTAVSEKRSLEVGIRKTFGAFRYQLTFQFLSESFIIVAFSGILSLLFVRLALPFFNNLSEKQMMLPWSKPIFWLTFIGFSMITGLLSGSYPALFLSSFKPVKVLNRTFKVNSAAILLRKVLVVIQFTVSIILITGTIVVIRQIQFAKGRPIGYNVNGLIAIPVTTPDIHKAFNVVRNELKREKVIVSMSESGAPTTEVWGGIGGLSWTGKDPNMAVVFPNTDVSADFGKTIGWQFIAGRDFSKDIASDSSGFIINETAMKYMGLKNPIGEKVTWNGTPFHIVGVTKDMIVESPYEPVQPSLFHLSPRAGRILLVKLNPQISTTGSLTKIEAVLKKYSPAQVFDYRFVDDEYGRKFFKEERTAKLACFFSAIAILVSCLGLFAMASFMTTKRIKEIGIRKVFGASVINLWGLLSKDFVKLVLYAIVVAFPISSALMNKWIRSYQYRTEISLWIFFATGVSVIIITLLTVSYKCIRAARMNPTENLRDI